METQNPIAAITEVPADSNPKVIRDLNEEFKLGDFVVYGLHGKCVITGVENRVVGADAIRFYKLEVFKAGPARSSRHEPAIWVPVSSSKDRGLRPPMSAAEIEASMKILASREYFFPVNESWSVIHPKLENTLRAEGGVGFAKVISYLFVLKRQQVVPSSEVVRLSEQITRIFVREVAETQGKLPRIVEEEIAKLLRHKMLPDN